MTQQDYEQKKREYLEEFCKQYRIGKLCEQNIESFNWVFDRAYALGKQEKDVEGEPNPAEPKFKVGDKVLSKPPFVEKVWTVMGYSKDMPYMVQIGEGEYINERNLEPYTEPKGEAVKDGFSKHNRLHTASIIMAGLLAGGKEKHPVRRAMELADALIKEVEYEKKN